MLPKRTFPIRISLSPPRRHRPYPPAGGQTVRVQKPIILMLFCFTPLSALLRHRSAYVICFLFLRALHSPKSASNARHKIISSQCRFRCSPPPLSPTDSLPGSTPVKSQQQALPPPTPYTTQFDFAHRTRITALSNIIIIIISSSASSSQ